MDILSLLSDSLPASPLLKTLAIGFATWLLEDPVTLGCGFLVAAHRLDFWLAFGALVWGLTAGDFVLYLTGRFAKNFVIERGWLRRARLRRAERWFRRNAFGAIFGSRFMPGTRFTTMVAAGALRTPAWLFLGVALLATVTQTTIVLGIARFFGGIVLERFQRHRTPVVVLTLLAVAAANAIHWNRRRRRERTFDAGAVAQVSSFEFMHPWLFYLPVALNWIWLGIRHRGMMLPMASNPTIYSSGFVLESKSKVLELFPADLVEQWVGTYAVVPPAASVEERFAEAKRRAAAKGLDYPLVAKPDIGLRGAGVRRVFNDADLQAYLQSFPLHVAMILQTLIDLPVECGVLYVRRPDEEHGRIVSLTTKDFPFVVGDGKRTLRALILSHPRARIVPKLYFDRQTPEALAAVVPEGERRILVFAGNHCRGTIFHNGNHLVTPAMTATFDAISRRIPGFHYGRFDIRCESHEALREGRGFRIIELNGAGAESTHIWDVHTTLRQAYAALFDQYRMLFEIGYRNRCAGHRPISLGQFVRDALAMRRLARLYPPTE
jgi:membrane protein DedA with SNARE-associated domain